MSRLSVTWRTADVSLYCCRARDAPLLDVNLIALDNRFVKLDVSFEHLSPPTPGPSGHDPS